MYINQDKLNRLIDLYAAVRGAGGQDLQRAQGGVRWFSARRGAAGMHAGDGWSVVEAFCRRYVDEKGIVMPGFSRPYIYRQEILLYARSLRHNLLMAKSKTSRNHLDLALFAASFALILSFFWLPDPRQILPLAVVLLLTGRSVFVRGRLARAREIQEEIVNLLEYVDAALNRKGS